MPVGLELPASSLTITPSQEAVVVNAAPQRAFGSDQGPVGIGLEGGDAELFQMRGPSRLIDEVMIGMFGVNLVRQAARNDQSTDAASMPP
jgi:hypothetical protein